VLAAGLILVKVLQNHFFFMSTQVRRRFESTDVLKHRKALQMTWCSSCRLLEKPKERKKEMLLYFSPGLWSCLSYGFKYFLT